MIYLYILDVSAYPGFWRFAVSAYPYRISVKRSVKPYIYAGLGQLKINLNLPNDVGSIRFFILLFSLKLLCSIWL
jgi:hypothetical protein